MEYTNAQKAAMSLSGKTLLVSAAAGSGKTFTLTKRIIKAITEEGRDISRMLIVTFTRAAAGELRAKISKALSEAIAEDPGNTALQAQILKLSSAKISTIDSFFTEPIRANFEKLGLPASLRLADEAELSPLKEAIMGEVLEEAFRSCERFAEGELSTAGYRDLLTDLSGIISSARDTSALSPTLLEIYNKLNTSPEGVLLLEKQADRMEACAACDFFDTAEGKLIKDELTVSLRNIKESFAKIASIFAAPEEPTAYAALFCEDASRAEALLGALCGGYEEAQMAFSEVSIPSLPRLKKNEVTPHSEQYKGMHQGLNKPLKEAPEKYFFMTPEEISFVFIRSAMISKLLAVILSEFERKYDVEKAKKGLCEFADMPKFMLKLLLNEDGSYSDYANDLYASFDEVYIDEYQDVNEIQDRIFEIIGRDHRFMVGDIKQSIYGFREAEPSIFAAYRRAFPSYDSDEAAHPETQGNTVFMSNNFRCDKGVVDFTNLVCSVVFSAFSESIGYTAEDDLVFSKGCKEGYVSPKVVLSIVETAPKQDTEETGEVDTEDVGTVTGGNLRDEAILTANEIARLIRDEKDSDHKPLTPGSIAVLVRSHSHAKPLTEALEQLNIPYSMASKSGIFEDAEMRFLADLLQIIDNPRCDIPLSAILTEELPTLSSVLSFEELVRIRSFDQNAKARSLYDALLNYAESGDDRALAVRCAAFDEHITKLRLLSAKLPIDKLLRVIAANERYALLCQGDAFPYLYDIACKYVRNSWNGLYSFLKYLKNLMEKGESGKEAGKGTDNAVTVMTIHQSKGLEFNTCFLFGMGKQFNMADTRDPMICTKELGLSMKLPLLKEEDDLVSKLSVRYADTLLWHAGDLSIRRKMIEEEARILYVGLTRAKERLYVSGTLRKSFSEIFEAAADTPDIEYAIRQNKTYLSWILLALAKRDPEGQNYILHVTAKGKTALTVPFRRNDGQEAGLNATDAEADYARLLQTPYGESDEEKLLSMIPAKAAASKISRTMLDDGIFLPIPKSSLLSEGTETEKGPDLENERLIKNRIELMRAQAPDFDSLLEVNKKPTAAERGTATHRFLQYCDYEYAEKNGIDEEITRLREHRFISERTAEIIDKRSLAGFFKSELYRLIKEAKQVRREFRFGMFRSASEFTENETLQTLVAEKKIFVQGSVDLLIETREGEIILCDYKTDRISPEERRNSTLLAETMRQRHRDQMMQYRVAIGRIFGKEPKKMYIYAVQAGVAAEI